MKTSEFEEKDYEGPLYQQLLWGNNIICTPGQVFENAFGIDCFMQAHDPAFWEIFGYHDIPAGINLSNYSWRWVTRRYGKVRSFPNFPINLLIQAKRPDYLQGPRSDFSALGIKKEYWRFHVREHQQLLLHKLAKHLNNRALIVYASPAFDTFDDLHTHTSGNSVVDNSSFVHVKRMDGHESWNYDSPGCFGIAASEPERVYEQDFMRQISRALEEAPLETSAAEDLALIYSAIRGALSDSEENPMARHFIRMESRVSISRVLPEPLQEYVRINMFFDLVGISWLVAGHPQKILSSLK